MNNRTKRTPLTLPSSKAVVARCVIKSPSTTGIVTNVPKNPPILILLLAVSRTVAGTARRQAMASEAEVQLRHGKLSLRALELSRNCALCLSYILAEQQLRKELQYRSSWGAKNMVSPRGYGRCTCIAMEGMLNLLWRL